MKHTLSAATTLTIDYDLRDEEEKDSKSLGERRRNSGEREFVNDKPSIKSPFKEI